MPIAATDILFVTKPLSPPWDDSGKLLPYLIANRLDDVKVTVMTPRGKPLIGQGVVSEEIYRRSSSFSVPVLEKLKLMGRLLLRPTPPIVHFFFSPNGPTTAAARLFRRLKPGVKVIQTVMSLPARSDEMANALFGDVVVTWSRTAADLAMRAVEGRANAARIVHIPPGIEPLTPMDEVGKRKARREMGLDPDRPVILYAGDLEFSSAAEVTAAAVSRVVERIPALFVFACRRKTNESLAAERILRESLEGPEGKHVRIMDRVASFKDLLRCADVQVLPAETTYAKTDIPLVLLEGLSAGVPAVVAEDTPMQELVDAGAAVGIPPLEVDALARALIGILEGKGRARALGIAGRQYVLDRHTADSMARAHGQLYNEVLRFG